MRQGIPLSAKREPVAKERPRDGLLPLHQDGGIKVDANTILRVA